MTARAVRAPAATRIGGLDVARGLAVLGMFAAHMRLGDEFSPDPRTWTAVVDGIDLPPLTLRTT